MGCHLEPLGRTRQTARHTNDNPHGVEAVIGSKGAAAGRERTLSNRWPLIAAKGVAENPSGVDDHVVTDADQCYKKGGRRVAWSVVRTSSGLDSRRLRSGLPRAAGIGPPPGFQFCSARDSR
jgi:hypothetical protein